MKDILQYLFDYKTLSRKQASEVLTNISKGLYSDTQIASFVTVFLMRSITIEEMQGFRDALLELCVPVDMNGYDVIDIVGTGGDGKNTFNISTLSCFIVAGAGYKVAKHGNYGATSVSGASNVMESHGYKFSNNSDKLKKEIEAANICFLHAPLFHPALKTVAPVRKNLGIRTFFNLMGPLVNPCGAASRMIGVYNLEVGRLYRYVLENEPSSFSIVHSLDGYDEISLTADTRIITKEGEQIMDALTLGKRTTVPSDIYGGTTAEEASKLFYRILNRQGSWAQNAVVLANASVALQTATGKDYNTCYEMSVESFESGRAMEKFKQLMQMQ
jgi:anthranilate phosphoribosyltransferase